MKRRAERVIECVILRRSIASSCFLQATGESP
jgi:hypothetical protein